MHLLALFAQAVAQAGLNLVQQVVDIAPVGGGFQGVHRITGGPQAMAQIGEAEAVFCPFLAQQGAGKHAVKTLQQLLRLLQ